MRGAWPICLIGAWCGIEELGILCVVPATTQHKFEFLGGHTSDGRLAVGRLAAAVTASSSLFICLP